MMASVAIRNARVRAGITQAELARRLGTTQSAIARLEGAGANPTVSTVERVLAATGHRLLLATARTEPGVDGTLIAEKLRMSPADRVKSFESFNRDARRIMLAGQHPRSEHAA